MPETHDAEDKLTYDPPPAAVKTPTADDDQPEVPVHDDEVTDESHPKKPATHKGGKSKK